MSGRKTQKASILARLLEAKGAEVPAYELAQVGGLQFQTRIYELRHELHFPIKNRTERDENHQVHSYYWLELGVPIEPAEIPTKPKSHPTLFDMERRHLDLG